MLNATKNVDDVIRITGNQQQQIAISTAVVQTGPLSPGIYDVWSTVDCYIAVYPFRRADVLVSTPALTADIGYFLSANKTVSVRIEEGDVLQSLGVASGTLKYMNVQGQGVTSAAITPPVNTAPSAFAINQWSVVDTASGGTVTVTITSLPSDGGSAITTIQYKAGAGEWTNSGIASTGTFNITGLTNGAAVNVLVRAVNAIGNGPDSDTKSVTPTATPAIPFTYDANTYFWDFAASDNMSDSAGVVTLTQAKDRTANKATVLNYNKAWQPLKVTGGITFNQATNRVLTFDLPPTITNGKNGWYVAFTMTPTTSSNGVVMSISGPASTVNSRMYIDFTGSRNVRLRFGASDSTTLATLFTSAQLTLGQKYAIEILFDFDADTYTLWINGVNQNVTVTGGPWSNFPSSNPREVLIGNFTSGNLSLDAVLNNIVFQDGVPSSDIRTSVSAFQQIRQTA